MTKDEYDQLVQMLASLVDPKAYDDLAVEELRLFLLILKQVRKYTLKAINDKIHAHD